MKRKVRNNSQLEIDKKIGVRVDEGETDGTFGFYGQWKG